MNWKVLPLSGWKEIPNQNKSELSISGNLEIELITFIKTDQNQISATISFDNKQSTQSWYYSLKQSDYEVDTDEQSIVNLTGSKAINGMIELLEIYCKENEETLLDSGNNIISYLRQILELPDSVALNNQDDKFISSEVDKDKIIESLLKRSDELAQEVSRLSQENTSLRTELQRYTDPVRTVCELLRAEIVARPQVTSTVSSGFLGTEHVPDTLFHEGSDDDNPSSGDSDTLSTMVERGLDLSLRSGQPDLGMPSHPVFRTTGNQSYNPQFSHNANQTTLNNICTVGQHSKEFLIAKM